MGFRFVVQEKQEPYDWMIWELSKTTLKSHLSP